MKKNDTSSPIEPIICITHRLEAIANKYVFQPMGFSHMSMKILKSLATSGPLTSSDLIRITSATKSNMSQRLSFLEKEDYVTRTHAENTGDKRKVIIKLTASGKRRLTDLEKRLQKAQISFEKKFTKNEIAQHKAFFKKLSVILDNGEHELAKIFKS
ncbi:MAG: ArsR family transcriptional regulator [Candidatus Moranbacteria bacterium]|nr:ArsR family transcriptional regulator [Candidatus Moranbacteria bacterium]